MNKSQVAAKFKKCLDASSMSSQLANTKKCQAAYVGDVMNYTDHIQFADKNGKKKRALVTFNKVMPYVDAVAGFMQQNRREIKFIARSSSSLKQVAYSKYMNAAYSYVRDACGAAYIEGEQDLDMLVCGYGAVETDLSYIQGNSTTCPNGEVIKQRIDPSSLFWDVSARRKNLSDRRWCGYWQEYALQDALDLFSDSKETDFQSVALEDEGEYYYNPYGGRYDKVSLESSVDWVSEQEKKVKVYNFQWFEYESYWQADNPIMFFQSEEAKMNALIQMQALVKSDGFGDMFDFDPTAQVLTFDAQTKTKLVEMFGDSIQPVEFKRRAYYTAVVSGKHVFTWFKSVSQNDFSILFKTGTFDPIRKLWIGMVNNMIEPQLYYNKALTELLFTISANSKGGVIVEREAVEDVQEFEDKYASTTAVVVVNEGAISQNKIMPKGNNVPTTGLEGIIQLADASVADASGVDKAFLGGGVEKVQAGILYRRRIRQVMSTIAKYFDSVSMFQKTQARVDLDFMRIWSENNDGVEFDLPEDDGGYSTAIIASDKFMAEYGVVLQEAMETAEDKQEKAEMISTIGDKVAQIKPKAALTIWSRAVNYLNLDADDKQAIMRALEEDGQSPDPAYIQQLEQQVALLSSETNKADIQRKLAGAQKDIAAVDEIKARTAKTLEEAQRTGVETQIMTTAPNPTVNI